MKKLVLLLAIATVGLCYSCDKEPREKPQEESVGLTGTWRTLLLSDYGTGDDELELVFTTETVDFSCTNYPHGRGIEEGATTYELEGTYTCDNTTVTITVSSPENLAGESYSGRHDDKGAGITKIMFAMRTALMRGETRSETAE